MIFFKEQFMEKKNRRRWAFDSYKHEQRAIHKLVHTLLDGLKDKTNVVVAWGDGSFGPTSRGHASAPNAQSAFHVRTNGEDTRSALHAPGFFQLFWSTSSGPARFLHVVKWRW